MKLFSIRNILGIWGLVILLSGCALSVLAGDLPKGFDHDEMMPVSEVKPGMKGTVRSVFRGVSVEEYGAEILGVFPGFFAKQSIIFARLDIPFEGMGVIAGMSGSPVFVDGRMIGAVAYGWGFTQEPVAGITPIEYMMEVYDRTKDSASSERSEINTGIMSEGYWTYSKPWFTEIAPTLKRPDWETEMLNLGVNKRGFDFYSLQPLGMPLCVSTNNPLVMKLLEGTFSPYGLFPVSTGAGGGDGTPADYPVPTADDITHGSALGVAFMTGDLTMGGIGTVTYRKDNKLVAFGHPMMGEGESKMPFTSAIVLTIMRSYMRPFKLGYPAKVIGTVDQDYQPAIGGFFGEGPPMIPYNVEVLLKDTGKKHHFSYEIVRHKRFTPSLVLMGVAESLSTAHHWGGKNTAILEYTVETIDGEKIQKDLYFSRDTFLGYDMGYEVLMDVAMLLTNPYRETDISKIDLKIEIQDELKQAQLWGVRANKERYYPGDEVKVTLFLQPYRDKLRAERISLNLPEDIRPGTYDLHILSGTARAHLEAKRSPGLFQMRNFEDIVRVLNISYPANKLFVVLQERSKGVSINGQEITSLPPTTKGLIDDTLPSFQGAPVSGEFLKELEIPMDFEVQGMKTLTVRVERDRYNP